MGIDKNRFIGDHHQVFLCPVCKDVSSYPILSSCCESTFCDECWTKHVVSPTDHCPSCGQTNDPTIEKKSFQKQLKIVYSNLAMKCLERSCDQKLTISNYGEHDATCLLKKYHCYKCGYKGKMIDSKEHDCVRWLKQERSQLLEKNMELTVKLKVAQNSSKTDIEQIHDEEVDRIMKENVELKKQLQRMRDALMEAVKDKDHFQTTFDTTMKLLNMSLVQKRMTTKSMNGNADLSELNKNKQPSTSSAASSTSSGVLSSRTLSPCPAPLFSSNLSQITLPKESELKKEAKVTFVEEASKAKKEVRQRVSVAFVEVFKGNDFQGLNVQRKCLEVSKELKKSLTGSWYTFPKNHFNPQGFRPFLNTFCLFYFEGRYYVSFQNNGPVEEKSVFLNHYLRFK